MQYGILKKDFLKKQKIINFESTHETFNRKKITKGVALYSSQDVLKALKFLNVVCTSHANNHVSDFSYDLPSYLSTFTKAGIKTIGLGNDIMEAGNPFIDENEKLLVLSFGWETIRCKRATIKTKGVNPYRYKWVEDQVLKYKENYSKYRIVLFIHWNYEFETYPLPADRQFAHHLIDIGVDGIFGHHPHIINGQEIYKGKPIFYSLGNLYFPQVKYGNHLLRFRNTALEGISVEYNGDIEGLKIYHHRQDKLGESLILLRHYDLSEWERLNKLSEFCEFNNSEYASFYKKNRFHKKKLLPIYKSYKNNSCNLLLNKMVRFRQVFVDIISKLK